MAQQTIQDASMQYAGNGAPNRERINDNFDELYQMVPVVLFVPLFLVFDSGSSAYGVAEGTFTSRVAVPSGLKVTAVAVTAVTAISSDTCVVDVKNGATSLLTATMNAGLLNPGTVNSVAGVVDADEATVAPGGYIDVIATVGQDASDGAGLAVTIVGVIVPT